MTAELHAGGVNVGGTLGVVAPLKGKDKGMKGQHINNVKHHPEQAGNPDNIEFLTQKEHLNAHDGNFKNKTTGELKNRKIE